MKKVFAIFVITAMLFSLCACGGAPDRGDDPGDDLVSVDPNVPADSGDNTEVDGEGDADTPVDGGEDAPVEGGEITDPALDPDTPVENPQDDADAVTDGPVFANDWATNDIEKMLPNPPFGPWEKTGSPENLHIIATPLEAIDYSVEGRDRMALANYFAWLEGMGFTVKEVGYSSKEILGAELPDHWLIIDRQGRVAQLSIYCNAERKDELVGYSIITFELETFGIEDSGSSESYDPRHDSDPIADMDEVLSFLPALPFSEWSGGHEGGNIYEYSVTGLNTSGATNPPDSGEPDGLDKDIFLDWLATLPSYGLDVRETGAGYRWTAADAYGNFVTFMIGDGGLFLTVEKGETVTPQQPSGGEDTPSQGGSLNVGLPELPYGEWSRRDVSSTDYDLIGVNVDEWEMCEVFISDLYGAGYNVFEIFFDPDLAYEYQAEKGTADGLIIINIQGDIPNQNAVIKVRVK